MLRFVLMGAPAWLDHGRAGTKRPWSPPSRGPPTPTSSILGLGRSSNSLRRAVRSGQIEKEDPAFEQFLQCDRVPAEATMP
jgi:hypothetical protein